ncbi:LOW QUALITY PROTEIN: uncharacterized protein LOC128251678 [Drosophila gunungcola]|uniref:LOW QUALITY PROTEIN: uncharacterized protein LOC128251678 n=1 Tax=Drosophila gunungcola TaxID=103775 RepID=UPI0022E50E3E|nr:LOW QUALITY PROTEIN: uncharacterized protein LOC128251678 [Drosophila gunungcola]
MSSSGNSLHAKLVSLVSRGPELTSIFFFAPVEEKCHLEETLASATWGLPLVIWRSNRTVILNGFLGEGLLVLACLPGLKWRALLSSLSRSLKYLRQARVLIELMEARDELLVQKVLEFSLSQEMTNANVIFGDFAETQRVSRFEAFPQFKVVNYSFTENTKESDLYPDKMLDLRGGVIRTMPDYSEPNTILYQDKQGNKQILGYLWDIMEAYAKKHNAQLQVVNKYADGRTLNFIELLDVARSVAIDIAASIQPMSMGVLERTHEMSYPVNLASWCTMLPVERHPRATDLIEMRNALNTSFGYTVTSEKWKLYNELQKRSSRPLFRYSKDLCFYELVPFGLVIPENSAHRAPLHRFILLLWQSGLHDLWVSRGFSNMVKAGKIHFAIFGERYQAHTLNITDLRHVLMVYGSGVLISLFLFACELSVSWVSYWLGF